MELKIRELKGIFKHKTNWIWILKIVIFLMSFIFLSRDLISTIKAHPIHVDELIFINRGKFFNWYIKGEFNRLEWDLFESYDNPKLAEYFYGLINIRESKNELNISPDAFVYFATNTLKITPSENKEFPEINNYIINSRTANTLSFAIPTLIIIFLIGNKSVNYNFGLFSMILIGSNKLYIDSMTTAMAEGFLWFLFLFFLYLSLFQFGDKKNRNLSIQLTSTLALVAGLAISVKLNGIILGLFFLVMIIYKFLKKEINTKQFFINLMLFGVISISIFILINPFTWKNPLLDIQRMIIHRTDTFKLQAEQAPRTRFNSFNKKIYIILSKTITNNYLYINFKTIRFPIRIFLLTTLPFLLINNSKKASKTDKKVTLLIYFIVLISVTTIMLPLDWARYYLPFIFAWGFLEAYFLSILIDIFFQKKSKN